MTAGAHARAPQPRPRGRLLLLTSDYPPNTWSGIGAVVAEQAAALSTLGFDVDVLVGDPRPRPALETLHVTGPRMVAVHALSRQRFPLEPSHFDWIHLHSMGLAVLGLELQRRFGLRLAYTVHALMHLELGTRAGFWPRLQHALVRACDRIIYLSQAEKVAAERRWPELTDRGVVVPNGLAPHKAGCIYADKRSGPVVFAGRFTRNKGFDFVLRLSEALLDRGVPEVVLAGGHGDADLEAAAHAVARRLSGRIRCPGWLSRQELRALFCQASVVVAPSRYEPFGMVPLEAMATGTPVLTSDVGGFRDVVTEQSGGSRIGTFQLDDWANAVVGIRRDEIDYAKRCQSAVTWSRERFPVHATALRLADVVYEHRCNPSTSPATSTTFAGVVRMPAQRGGHR